MYSGDPRPVGLLFMYLGLSGDSHFVFLMLFMIIFFFFSFFSRDSFLINRYIETICSYAILVTKSCGIK